MLDVMFWFLEVHSKWCPQMLQWWKVNQIPGNLPSWPLQKATPWSWSSSWKRSWEEIGRKLNRRGRSPKKQKRLWSWQGRWCVLHVVGFVWICWKVCRCYVDVYLLDQKHCLFHLKDGTGWMLLAPPTHPILTMSCGYLRARHLFEKSTFYLLRMTIYIYIRL